MESKQKYDEIIDFHFEELASGMKKLANEQYNDDVLLELVRKHYDSWKNDLIPAIWKINRRSGTDFISRELRACGFGGASKSKVVALMKIVRKEREKNSGGGL